MAIISHEECVSLEQLIDRVGVADVLSCIAEIATAKAAHVAENWNDTRLARAWTMIARRTLTLSGRAVDL